MTAAERPSDAGPSLAERRRWATQVEIAEAAAAIFAEQGYDATTVEQIADRAGIGLRTFYRYCSGKDDVFSAVLGRNVATLVETLRDTPASTTLAQFVIGAFTGKIQGRETPPLSDKLGVLLTTIPQLRSRLLGAEGLAQQGLVSVIAERLGLDEQALRARATASIIIASATAAVEHSASTGQPLEDCLIEVMELIEHGI